MNTLREIEEHFQYLPNEILDILIELRNQVARIAPDATEVFQRKGITYYHADRGGPVSAGVCQILVREDHIELAFIHGAFLPDPHHLLMGNLVAKRYIPILSYDQAPWEDLADMIDSSDRFDPYTQTFRIKSTQ